MKKMSDVFYLPLAQVPHFGIVDIYGNPIDDDLTEEKRGSLAHAINCHDELVDILERINCCIGWGYSDSELAVEIKVYASEIESLLKKARGEA